MTQLTRVSPAACDERAVAAVLLRLLAVQLDRLTRGESTSVPAQTAQRVLDSLCFVLGLTEDLGNQARLALLLAPDKEAYLDSRVALLRREVRSAQALLLALQDLLPKRRCRALSETLRSLASFPKRYDPRFAAQEVPCDMDYQLSEMPDERLQGVHYVRAWLKTLLMETELLRRIPEEAADAALTRLYPDWPEQVMAQYAPVADCALGRSLLKLDPRALLLSPAQAMQLRQDLGALSAEAVAERLDAAADFCCDALGIRQRSAVAYLKRHAAGTAARLVASELSGVFLTGPD